jgi:hypothetical protein
MYSLNFKKMYTTQNNNGKSLLMTKILYAMFFGLLVFMIPACNKDEKKAQLSVRMTDAPANYDAVMVDVQGVEVTGNGGALVMLNVNKGIYNLSHFTNGLDTLIASGALDAGTISQIRLILGDNNSVVVNNVVYHLSTPSAEQSGLKLQIHQTFEAGVSYTILLDFDANQSIVERGNGDYQLKPVLRTINAAVSGSIKGSISPISLGTSITATSNGVVYSTVANLNGYFMIAGLPAGTYNITVTPVLPLQPITITGKTVVIGASTDLGIIVF